MLLIAARLTSVLSGTMFAYILIKIAKRLFQGITKYFSICLGIFLPQLIFLSSYVNNDVIALLGTAIIVLSWIRWLEEGANFKSALLMAIGIIICSLSYYFSYGYILMSMVFILLYFRKKNPEGKYDRKKMVKYASFIAITVLVFISFFFIRNLILTGSFWGYQSFVNQSDGPKYTVASVRIPLWYMIFKTRWLKYTAASFICVLSYMTLFTKIWVYQFYYILLILGCIGVGIKTIFQRKAMEKYELLYICFPFCLVIPIILTLVFSYHVSYQPQGRYLYGMFIPLNIVITFGIDAIIEYSVLLWKKIQKNLKLEKIQMMMKYIVFWGMMVTIFYITFIVANQLLIENMMK